MIGNSTDDSVEDEGIVIEEMIIVMNLWQKGWKLFLLSRRRSMKMCTVTVGPQESPMQRMMMRIYAIRQDYLVNITQWQVILPKVYSPFFIMY